MENAMAALMAQLAGGQPKPAKKGAMVYRAQDGAAVGVNPMMQYLQLLLGIGGLSTDRELGLGNLQLGQQRLGLESQLGMGRLGIDRESLGLQRELGTRGLANDQARIDLQRLLGMRELDIRNQLGNRELDLTQDTNYFNRIMRGVSEAALPGVRAGRTPTQSFGGGMG